MDLLNLDSLVTTKRKVVLNGEEHNVADQTVGMMLDALAVSKMSDETDGEKMFVQMVGTAKRILPTCSEDIIESMTTSQLAALIEYAMASDEVVVTNSESEVEEEEEGK